MEETGVPGVPGEDYRLKPQVTGNFLTYLGRDSNPGSGERQRVVSGGAADHTAVRAGPVVFKPAGRLNQGLSQDLETECIKLAISKFWGILSLKGHHNKLRL